MRERDELLRRPHAIRISPPSKIRELDPTISVSSTTLDLTDNANCTENPTSDYAGTSAPPAADDNAPTAEAAAAPEALQVEL